MRILRAAAPAIILTALVGCARFPPTPSTTGRRLVITMKVRGRISPVDPADPSVRRHYFVAIDNDGDQYTGPWAAVYPPYANGWVTSNYAAQSIGVTSYAVYDAANPSGYVYGILPGSYFLNTTPPQSPISCDLADGGSTLRFIIDFSQIATTKIQAADIKQLDVNFITTNVLAVNPDQIYENRQWDALGPSGQNYVTIDVTTDRIYSDEDMDTHSITDLDLDIVSWSIQIQTVSSR